VADHALLEGVPRDQALAIERAVAVERRERGALLAGGSDDGEAIRLVLSGRVRLFRAGHEGRQLTLAVLGEGDAFGELGRLDGVMGEQAEALEDVVVATLEEPALSRAIAGSPQFAVNVLRLFSERLLETEAQLERLAFRPVSERLAATIVALMERYGRVTTRGIRIDGRYTHAQLAEMIGTSRETLTKALGELRDQGVVDVRERLLWVVDAPALERLAGQ
jgi:CRP/FNR family transcriptional regulator